MRLFGCDCLPVTISGAPELSSSVAACFSAPPNMLPLFAHSPQAALRQALESKQPTLINVAIDPQASPGSSRASSCWGCRCMASALQHGASRATASKPSIAWLLSVLRANTGGESRARKPLFAMPLPNAPPSLSPGHLHHCTAGGRGERQRGCWGQVADGLLCCAVLCYAVLCRAVLCWGRRTVGISGGSPRCACLTSGPTLASVSAGARLQRAQRRQRLAATEKGGCGNSCPRAVYECSPYF